MTRKDHDDDALDEHFATPRTRRRTRRASTSAASHARVRATRSRNPARARRPVCATLQSARRARHRRDPCVSWLSLGFEQRAETCLAAFVMGARRADGHREHGGSVLDGEGLVEHEMQDLLLSRAQLAECCAKGGDAVVGVRRVGTVRVVISGALPPSFQSRELSPVPSSLFPRGHADHAEEPRAEGRTTVEVRSSIQHLAVGRVEHVLGLVAIATAAAHGPGEGAGVSAAELVAQIEGRQGAHSGSVSRRTPDGWPGAAIHRTARARIRIRTRSQGILAVSRHR